ncbi:MAG: AHH domain-containing protein [Myxococcales bacterium]|nr:AHH domain-containing protein [Myxococcales bacterium]
MSTSTGTESPEMQIGEMIHVFLGMVLQDRCPFCTDPDDPESYTTYEGAKNSSKKLRTIMNDPSCLTAEQGGARPKDGTKGKQSIDDTNTSPNPIYRDDTTQYPGLSAPIGAYGNEAHHSISGNECMKGEPIEDVIKNKNGEYEGETGYSINNAANGVYLPSWSRARWGSGRPDGTWGDLSDGLKYDIMKAAMRSGAGQAHIGSHDGKTTAKHPQSYPNHVKTKLSEITDRIASMRLECPEAKDKDPWPVPYGVNQWLDDLSRGISAHLKGHPRSWKYFVSQYAADYHGEVCRHGTIGQLLPDNWPPL